MSLNSFLSNLYLNTHDSTARLDKGTEAIIFLFFALFFGCFLYWTFTTREYEEKYAIVTYKVHYPDETITKTKTIMCFGNYEPCVKSKKGSNKLICGSETLEQTTCPIEITNVEYYKRTYNGYQNR